MTIVNSSSLSKRLPRKTLQLQLSLGIIEQRFRRGHRRRRRRGIQALDLLGFHGVLSLIPNHSQARRGSYGEGDHQNVQESPQRIGEDIVRVMVNWVYVKSSNDPNQHQENHERGRYDRCQPDPLVRTQNGRDG